ncbi:hypothetical protein G6027_16100 [Dietzia sp. SLG310A2-38A2]|uniref:hypothetical protein n=1 Tax=Dietzia sp. SLG310A2-38A2 TaxID=1630643 RepID=UPI0015F9D15B|nr:hypothetical protein [Dietzia sp. SLG310A2-38A2]MBB1032372.1 hypothetical protein [Dietzia sp. SLG310A2-38A2]
MTNHNIAEVLCDAVTDAPSDRRALAEVAGIVKVALGGIITESTLSEWSTEQERDQFLALASYLKRTSSLVHLGALMLDLGERDEAWALINGAVRPIEELLVVGLGFDADDTAATYLQLDTLATAVEQGSEPELELRLVDGNHHQRAQAVSLITDARLGRAPEVFLDENRLDARFVSTGWDLITTGAACIRDHVRDWDLMDDINAVAHAIEQARDLNEDTYPSAA